MELNVDRIELTSDLNEVSADDHQTSITVSAWNDVHGVKLSGIEVTLNATDMDWFGGSSVWNNTDYPTPLFTGSGISSVYDLNVTVVTEDITGNVTVIFDTGTKADGWNNNWNVTVNLTANPTWPV